ncbi:hypothetical protein [Pseudomonas fluorescens]|uniref:Uncharacterized protein n=1 Tax=Pseudomonas fluorescens TaxID=294 RepID=A0A5E7NUV3_PSEFL|nr:hypothetical protein [Pseudomonas fluorescens]VVP40180.1 hypothetical protein PS880_04800 [Pseudomonas fluorescens]
MTTKEAVTFHKLERNLLPPTIQQAVDGFVKPEFLKNCTIYIATSSDIQLGDLVEPFLDVEGLGSFSRTPFEVTKEHMAEGIVWELPAYNLVAESGAPVTACYTVWRQEINPLISPAGKYKVK